MFGTVLRTLVAGAAGLSSAAPVDFGAVTKKPRLLSSRKTPDDSAGTL